MKVGFIGLGRMGMPMSRRLLEAGFHLTVHNRSRPKVAEIAGMGGFEAASAAEVADAADVVLACLPDVPTVEEVFLGHSVSRQQNVSEDTARKIDAEVHRIINEAYQKANQILTEKQEDLEALAKGLLEYETLTGDEIKALLAGNPPVRTPYDEPPPDSHRPSATVPQTGRPRAENLAPEIDPNPEPQPGT